jgi:hypothetical protein
MSGKGSGRRPAQVNEKAFSDNWDSIFGKGDKQPAQYMQHIGGGKFVVTAEKINDKQLSVIREQCGEDVL